MNKAERIEAAAKELIDTVNRVGRSLGEQRVFDALERALALPGRDPDDWSYRCPECAAPVCGHVVRMFRTNRGEGPVPRRHHPMPECSGPMWCTCSDDTSK